MEESGKIITDPCATCKGHGFVKKVRTIAVKIPPGVDTGSRLRMAGEGELGFFGGPPGDLYIVVAIEDHPVFGRKGSDIYCSIDITFPQAALGAEIDVPTLDGSTPLKIPSGTRSGQAFHIKHKGIPRLSGHGRGDEVVTVNIDVPKHLSPRQRELLEEFAQINGDKTVISLKHSNNLGHTWMEDSTFNPEGNDIRDPKFAVIGNRLFLYALDNNAFNPEPYQTVYSYTENGKDWSPLEVIPGVDGWLFWRPKTQDGITFYNAAYWYRHDKAVLLISTNGINWEIISTINGGERNDETEIIFLPDGRMLATARLEYDESWLEGALGDVRG